MDWEPTEMMVAIGDLAKQIYKGAGAHAWPHLAEAGLLDVEEVLDVCALLVRHGRAGAPVPLFETLCLGWPARQAGVVGNDVIGTAGCMSRVHGIRATRERRWWKAGRRGPRPRFQRSIRRPTSWFPRRTASTW